MRLGPASTKRPEKTIYDQKVMRQSALAERGAKGSIWIAAALGLAFLVFFLGLRSQQYMAVDGALRCLSVFHDPTNRLHGNNHMLYPFWIWLWTHTAAIVGFQTNDWLAYIRLCQAMNGFAAAASITALFTILEPFAGIPFALLGSLQFGLSTAVVLHATNSAEPVSGLFFSLVALAALAPALRHESNILLFVTGALLALALASYQAMALAASIAALACVCWPGGWTRVARRLVSVGAGGTLAILIVYGWAYSSLGIPPRRMVGKFLALDGDPGTYGGFKTAKILNVPFGLLRNVFNGLPPGYTGIRSLPHSPHRTFWICVALASLTLFATLAWLVGVSILRAVRRREKLRALIIPGIFLTGFVLAFPLIYWDPLYDKLWLLPLAAMTLAAGFAFRLNDSARARRTILSGLLVVLVIEAAVNIPRAARDHIQPTAHLDQARDLATIVTLQDHVVVDFDDVSMLWLAIWGNGRDVLVLPASKRNDVNEWLSSVKRNGSQSGTALLFVSVLDQERATWDAFLGRATGIPYADFECYRRESVILRRYHMPRTLTVRRLGVPSICTSSPLSMLDPVQRGD